MFDNIEDLKSHLTVSQTLKALVVKKQELSSIRTKYSSIMLKEKSITPIRDHPSYTDSKIMLLKPDADLSIIDAGMTTIDYTVTLGYQSLSWNEALHHALPEEVETPSSFETIGHIAHFNLNEDQMKFKKLIGEVILDKLPAITTVVAKTGNIENTFRVLPMEIIAGEDNFETTLKEEGCFYNLDFSKVYWNSRLSREHSRVANLVSGTVADVFAGIGPFVVPAAKREAISKVFANDLNPESFKYLQKNISLNKVEDKIQTFNLDGREFIRKVVQDGNKIDNFIMNLPALAPEFCDAFIDLFDDVESLPTVFIYSFAPKEDPEQFTKDRLSGILGVKCEGKVDLVRLVAPNKWMVCHEIKLPAELVKNEDASKKKLN